MTSSESHSQSCHYLACLAVPWKILFEDLSLFYLIPYLVRINFSQEYLLKTISSSSLTLQMLEVAITVGVSKKLTKKVLKNPPGGFEKFLYSPGNLEGPAGAWSCAHAQKSSEKALRSHLQFILRFYTSKKWSLRQSCKLYA